MIGFTYQPKSATEKIIFPLPSSWYETNSFWVINVFNLLELTLRKHNHQKDNSLPQFYFYRTMKHSLTKDPNIRKQKITPTFQFTIAPDFILPPVNIWIPSLVLRGVGLKDYDWRQFIKKKNCLSSLYWFVKLTKIRQKI